MREIKWEQLSPYMPCHARVGAVIMHVCTYKTLSGKRRWYARVSWSNVYGSHVRGKSRHSIVSAQKDAVELASEMLSDYHKALIPEMRRFDLVV